MQEFKSLSGVPLLLKRFQAIGNEVYYEIVGKESPMTNHQKAEIVSHLCQAHPHLMPRWKNELKGDVALGRNYLAVTEDGNLLIHESDIPTVVFAFDPTRENALKELLTNMTKELSLSQGLVMDLNSARLRIHGNKLVRLDYSKISKFMGRLPGGALVALENPKDSGITLINGSGFSKQIYNAALVHFTAIQVLKEAVVMPLSAINILMEHFKLTYRFPYLGDLNDAQIHDGIGISSSQLEDSFYIRISTADKRLAGAGVSAMLRSTDAPVCRQEVPPSVIPKSKM